MSSLPVGGGAMLAEDAVGTPTYATLHDGLAAAEDARNRDDSHAALCIFGDLRERFPEHPAPYLRAATVLSRLHRFDEAEQLLATGAGAFPNDPGFAIERAWLAYRRGDLADAIERWQGIRQSLPDHHIGYTGAAIALRDAARIAEADAVLVEAMQRFPDDTAPRTEYAWLAQIGRDWPVAIRRWEEVRQRHPDQTAGFTAGATALREARRFDEAEALLRDAVARFPGERAPLVEHAWLAAARRDWSEAARRWGVVREHFPDAVEAYLRGAHALSALWRHEEAEALLAEAMDRFPQDSDVACEHGWIAYHRHQLDEALARFETVRQRFPDLVTGYTAGAAVLRDQFHLAEAEAMLEAAQGRFPDEPRLPYEHARIPLFHPLRRERDPEEALRRTERLLARFPFFEDGYLLAVRTFRELGRSAEADELAQIGTGLLPQSAAIAIEHGHNARERGDWPEAIWRYGAVRQRFPSHSGGPIGLAAALSQSGRNAEAEQVLGDAMQNFPADPAVFAEFARIAVRQEDWAEALTRWSDAQKRFPDEQEFAHRIFEARLQLAESLPGGNAAGATAEASGEPAAEAPTETAGAIDPREATRDLVMQFESLGGTGLGCEFGMFQREFGAESLGLLRWADMPYDGVIFALESRFDGVGAPEHTEIFVNRENSRPEYCTRDRRGFMFMRAFVYEDEMPYERMSKEALRRLGFLKDKLVADLTAGGKIFVYRLTDRNLDSAQLERLHAAVRSYGDNMLLYVRYADAAHPNSTVELAAPGLMIGYIDRFKIAPDGQLSASPPSASWLAICKNAHALWLSTASLHSTEGQEVPAAARGLFRPKLHDADHPEKRDGTIRELLRQRAFERLYRPHPAQKIVDQHADLYDVAGQTIGSEMPVTLLEFGVAHGKSMGMFVERFTNPNSRFVGFDSFVGLPEAWRMHQAGAFSNKGVPPAIADKRVSFVKGWFQNTVPSYLDCFKLDPAQTYLIHFDADLYSSTLFLLSSLWPRIPEYYFIMDDFTQDDMSALFDFALAYPVEIEFLAQTRRGDGSGPPVPAQVFGRMRRIEFEPEEAGTG
jgi:tetratricopeptide (TPR) repeat protein